MVVFTWFNEQLVFDAKKDAVKNLSEKWKKRFKRFFETEMVNENEWAEQWTTEGGFKNIFPFEIINFPGKLSLVTHQIHPKRRGTHLLKSPTRTFNLLKISRRH